MRTKLKLSCVLASLAALTALAMAGTATAGEDRDFFEAGDPMTTNVPYVAWAGEEVRLVKCIDDPEGDWEGTDAEWAIVDSSVRQRSGDLRDPVFFDDTDRRTGAFAGGFEQAGRTCWAIDVDSVNPGMTRIKMAVDGNEGTPGSPVLKHDFLVIWLNMSAPVLTELSDAAFPGYAVGDPLGDGNFAPIDCSPAPGFQGCFKNGLIRVQVTGSFTDLHGAARTLPADWAALAGTYAFDTSGYNPMAWDIHDDQLETEGHTPTSMCGGTAAIDAVDNCLGGGEVGRFSRTVGGTGQLFGETIGPFDPARPDTSYLPDGKLDAGDAPMPAARIDVDLAGGVGALAAADKHVLYSRNRTGTGGTGGIPANNAHNLYAPFYMALIPADFSQIRPSYTTSGITGPIPNNFPGYQTEGIFNFGVRGYHYWDLLNRVERRGVNACRDVGGTGQFGPGASIPRPTGVNGATVYTDEHGEAIVQFLPDVGAALTPDSNGRCDLGEINGPALLGSATIQAEAMDPFELTFNAPRLSNTLTKNVFELAGKSLDCVAKSATEVFCVETIRDIRGNPVVGAEVSFTREPRGLIIPASLALGGYDTRGQVIVSATDNEVRVRTNALGQAGIELKSTLPGLVDLDAENVGTRNGGFGVQRVRCIRFAGDGTTLPNDAATCAAASAGSNPAPPAPVTPVTPVVPVTPVNPSVSNTSAPAATIVSLAGNPVPAAKPEAKPEAKPQAKQVATKLASARLVFVNGKRYLVVRANGSAPTAKIRITLVMRTGKAKAPVVRTISTNKPVRVANLEISKHVRTVRVALAK
jgi:hypothetical protein